ncbi:hypothetical protein AAC387_Pa10g0347 [Persea americana]
MRKDYHMASGAVDREYDFNISGLVHLKSVDWSNKDHKQVIAASLVNGVYAWELYRKKDAALAQLWWSSFRFKLVKELIDDCGSLYGYITYFERREALGNTEAGRMEAKYTLRALVNNLVTLIDKDRDYVPFYLLPTANLNTYARSDSFREAHKLRQWWRENLQLKCTFYPYSP